MFFHLLPDQLTKEYEGKFEQIHQQVPQQIPQQIPQQMPHQMPQQETPTTKQINFKQNVDSLTKAFNQKYTNLQKQNADSKVLKQAHDEFIQQYGKSKILITLKGKSSTFRILKMTCKNGIF